MDWYIKEDSAEEKSELSKNLDSVKKIYIRKLNSFIKGMDNEIDGISIVSLHTDGMSGIINLSLNLNLSGLEDRKEKIKLYVAKNTAHGVSGINEKGEEYDAIIT